MFESKIKTGKEKALIISDQDCKIYSILRSPSGTGTLVVFVPARTGSRIGPQRMFVEIARKLLDKNISSLCIDLPPLGDSQHFGSLPFYKGNIVQQEVYFYRFHLEKIYDFLKENYQYNDYVFCSISTGCIPILDFAQRKNFSRVVLISPNHLTISNSIINSKNVKSYFLKLLNKETWLKLIYFQLNYGKIMNNMIIINKTKDIPKSKTSATPQSKSEVNVLSVFGEKDSIRKECQKFWRDYKKKGGINYSEHVIESADHSFFGWNIKNELINIISNWL